jgi:hypothetical protein
MLAQLTPEQDALQETVAQEYIANLLAPAPLDMATVRKWLTIVYGYYDKPLPGRIEIANSPDAALALAAELTGEPQTELDWCGVGDGGWIARYDYFTRIGVLTGEESTELHALRDYCAQVWDSVLLDGCAIVIARPKSIRVDDDGNLHGADGPAIEWLDGGKEWAWHGTWVTERMIAEPRSFTRAEYLKITNTEERRALSEIAGWQWVAELLGAKTINEWTDPATGLRYELLACDSGGPKLIKKQSPALKKKAQPDYLEPVHEELVTAQAARKWQAFPQLSPADCERDPVLTYGVEA